MNSILELSKDRKTILSVYNKSIKKLIIPSGITSIGDCAFEGCSSLESIDIPNSVTKIGWAAFCFCSILKSIDVPNSVIKIKEKVFEGCSALESIDIPNSITFIGKGVFSKCKNLKNITIRCPRIEEVKIHDTFDDIDFDNCILHIPSGTRWAYRHHPIFSKFKNIVTERFD